MNSKQIGNITEVETMLSFMKLGYNVLIPYGDCTRYDYIIDDNKGNFIKIQCKTSRTNDGGKTFFFSSRSSNRKKGKIIHHRYSKDEIDYFATTFNNKVYLVPVNECGDEKKLRIVSTKNQNKGISWAKDYEFENVIKNW